MAQNKVIGPCRLCCKNTELKLSHILPAFVWRAVKRGDNGQYLYLHGKDGKNTGALQQQEYREHLLCEDCEGLISRWERPVGKLANRWIAMPRFRKDGSYNFPEKVCEGYQYEPFKKFFVATFWRMSVSEVDYFKDFKLPADVEQRLGELTLADDIGDPFEFPLTAALEENLLLKDYFAYPTIGPDSVGRLFVEFLALGFAWRLHYHTPDMGDLEPLVLREHADFVCTQFDFSKHKLAAKWHDAVMDPEYRKQVKLPPIPAPGHLPNQRYLQLLGFPAGPVAYHRASTGKAFALYRQNILGQLGQSHIVYVGELSHPVQSMPLDWAKSRYPGLLDHWPPA